ncbi:MAG TPA: hypothetical protein VEN47_03115 [Myxococcota bacterium]|nr:hypothetical protein [Myxococcota bacterium]
MTRKARTRPKPRPLPPGAVLLARGRESHWSVLSRGDRLHGRTYRPAEGDPAAAVILCTPDGTATDELVLRARSIWAGRAVAVFDLVLCGSRRSDKLSAQVFDPAQPLALRLHADLAGQTAADLAAVTALLRADPALDGAQLSLVAAGRGAALAREFAAGPHGLAAVVVDADAKPDDAWLRAVAARLTD